MWVVCVCVTPPRLTHLWVFLQPRSCCFLVHSTHPHDTRPQISIKENHIKKIQPTKKPWMCVCVFCVIEGSEVAPLNSHECMCVFVCVCVVYGSVCVYVCQSNLTCPRFHWKEIRNFNYRFRCSEQALLKSHECMCVCVCVCVCVYVSVFVSECVWLERVRMPKWGHHHHITVEFEKYQIIIFIMTLTHTHRLLYSIQYITSITRRPISASQSSL